MGKRMRRWSGPSFYANVFLGCWPNASYWQLLEPVAASQGQKEVTLSGLPELVPERFSCGDGSGTSKTEARQPGRPMNLSCTGLPGASFFVLVATDDQC